MIWPVSSCVRTVCEAAVAHAATYANGVGDSRRACSLARKRCAGDSRAACGLARSQQRVRPRAQPQLHPQCRISAFRVNFLRSWQASWAFAQVADSRVAPTLSDGIVARLKPLVRESPSTQFVPRSKKIYTEGRKRALGSSGSWGEVGEPAARRLRQLHRRPRPPPAPASPPPEACASCTAARRATPVQASASASCINSVPIS